MKTNIENQQVSVGGGTPSAAPQAERGTNSDALSVAQPAVVLSPASGSEQPVFANWVNLQGASGTVFLDFGFIEPKVLGAIQEGLSSSGKLPERIDGRLAVRVAVGMDVVPVLHHRLGQLLEGTLRTLETQVAAMLKQKEGASPSEG